MAHKYHNIIFLCFICEIPLNKMICIEIPINFGSQVDIIDVKKCENNNLDFNSNFLSLAFLHIMLNPARDISRTVHPIGLIS
jgi:hypothetical protein